MRSVGPSAASSPPDDGRSQPGPGTGRRRPCRRGSRRFRAHRRGKRTSGTGRHRKRPRTRSQPANWHRVHTEGKAGRFTWSQRPLINSGDEGVIDIRGIQASAELCNRKRMVKHETILSSYFATISLRARQIQGYAECHDMQNCCGKG